MNVISKPCIRENTDYLEQCKHSTCFVNVLVTLQNGLTFFCILKHSHKVDCQYSFFLMLPDSSFTKENIIQECLSLEKDSNEGF